MKPRVKNVEDLFKVKLNYNRVAVAFEIREKTAGGMYLSTKERERAVNSDFDGVPLAKVINANKNLINEDLVKVGEYVAISEFLEFAKNTPPLLVYKETREEGIEINKNTNQPVSIKTDYIIKCYIVDFSQVDFVV